jgi:hypothetical protein
VRCLWIKSNRTDNESAKLATDKDVIQGYCGVAAVDATQIIVKASAHATGAEQELLLPVLEACADQRTATTLIADNAMRRRDERFVEQEQHLAKPEPLHDKSHKPAKTSLFGSADFIIAPDQSYATCPAGKRLHRNGKD